MSSVAEKFTKGCVVPDVISTPPSNAAKVCSSNTDWVNQIGARRGGSELLTVY